MYPLKSLVHDANFTPNWAIQQQRSSRLTAAASGPGLDALALADLDGGLVVDGRSAHSLLDLSGHGQESLLDVGSALGGGLKEGDSKAVGEFLGDSVLHDLLVLHIALVSDEELVDALGGVAVNLLQPLLDVVERVHVRHIVNDADTVSATVVRGSDGSETLLTGGVPNLQLHCLSIELDGPDFEVDTDGRYVTLRVCVVSKTQQKTRLSDTGVSDEEELKEIIVSGTSY